MSFTKKIKTWTHPRVLQALALAGYNTARKMLPSYEPPKDIIHSENADTYILIPGYLGNPSHLDLMAEEIAKKNNVIHLLDKTYLNKDVLKTTNLAEKTLEYAFKAKPANSDLVILGHSNGGLSALQLTGKYHQDIKKVITLSSPLQGHPLREEVYPSSEIITGLQLLNLKQVAYDCHTTSLDHVTPHEYQLPSKIFMETNPQTNYFEYNETHWPFQQKPEEFVPKLYLSDK